MAQHYGPQSLSCLFPMDCRVPKPASGVEAVALRPSDWGVICSIQYDPSSFQWSKFEAQCRKESCAQQDDVSSIQEPILASPTILHLRAWKKTGLKQSEMGCSGETCRKNPRQSTEVEALRRERGEKTRSDRASEGKETRITS